MEKGRVAVRGARKNGLQHVCLDYGQTGGIWKRGHQRRRATMAAAMTTIGALHSSRFRIEIQDGAREGKKGRSGFSSNSSSTSLSSAIRLDWLFLGFLPLFLPLVCSSITLSYPGALISSSSSWFDHLLSPAAPLLKLSGQIKTFSSSLIQQCLDNCQCPPVGSQEEEEVQLQQQTLTTIESKAHTHAQCVLSSPAIAPLKSIISLGLLASLDESLIAPGV